MPEGDLNVSSLRFPIASTGGDWNLLDYITQDTLLGDAAQTALRVQDKAMLQYGVHQAFDIIGNNVAPTENGRVGLCGSKQRHGGTGTRP